MPSSINSTSSSPGGLIATGATDNELEIKTGDTTAISIDASQNVTVAGDLTVNGALNTTNVLAAVAGASVGAVGTYANLGDTVSTQYDEGALIAGSQLRWTSFSGSGTFNADASISTGARGSLQAASGTWMLVGRNTVINQFTMSIFLRVS
jgi:hypothetical protein